MHKFVLTSISTPLLFSTFPQFHVPTYFYIGVPRSGLFLLSVPRSTFQPIFILVFRVPNFISVPRSNIFLNQRSAFQGLLAPRRSGELLNFINSCLCVCECGRGYCKSAGLGTRDCDSGLGTRDSNFSNFKKFLIFKFCNNLSF